MAGLLTKVMIIGNLVVTEVRSFRTAQVQPAHRQCLRLERQKHR
jgi:hypothetical protein